VRSIIFAFGIIALMLVLAACDAAGVGTSTSPHAPGANELDKMIAQMETATVISRDLADSQARATSRADMTRQVLILSQQQTRIAGEALQTQTVFASNVSATASARNATATAQSTNATATREAAFATATAHTQNAISTATRDAVIVAQTHTSASATATANAANAKQTQVAAGAIQTRTSEETQTIAAKQNWERMTEGVRSVGMVLGVVLFVVGGLLFLGFIAYRVITLLAERYAREYRDANDELVIGLPDGKFVRPANMPEPVLDPARVLPATAQGDVTRRAQAVSLMLAARGGNANAVADAIAGSDSESDEATVPGNLEILKPFESRALALDQQPSRLALPIGVTERGAEMWISLNETTHALVGGPTRMGKSHFLHGWIQSLARGGQVDLALADGKGGMEFGRYAAMPRTEIVRSESELAPLLDNALGEMRRRFELMNAAGATNLDEYNSHRDASRERLTRRVIIVDELFDALTYDGVESGLSELARKGGAAGIQLVMSAQVSDAESVPRQLRANTTLRIAFACVSHSDSQSILGRAGAEKIEKTPGRLLVFWGGQIVQAQAFRVALPLALPGGNAGALPPPRALDDTSRQIVEYALREGGGMFVVTHIASALGIRPSLVNRVAMNFEKNGWLSSVEKDAGGQNIGRRILPQLAAFAGNVGA
jgi:hypothetical protein